MFDSHFRTLFLSNPAHLRLQSKRLIIERKDLLREKAPSFAEGVGDGSLREREAKQPNDKNLPVIASESKARAWHKPTATNVVNECASTSGRSCEAKSHRFSNNSGDCHESAYADSRNDEKTRDLHAQQVALAMTEKPPICHTEALAEVSLAKNNNRDISGLSPQYDNTMNDNEMNCQDLSDSCNNDTHAKAPYAMDGENNHYTPYKSNKRDEVAIPLADIACIILESPQITLTSALLDALTTHKVAVFSCDSSHLPSGIFTSFLGHYRSLSVLNSQIALKKQTKAILWQQIIKAKISNQCALLKFAKPNDTQAIQSLQNLAQSVNLGDCNNNEAKAAAVYFKALFGVGFSRMREGEIARSDINATINSALNYGYAIVRGAIVRSLASSGLSPALGLFHANTYNPFNLADDIIEPYRAFVDSLVLHILESSGNSWQNLTLANRVRLAQILSTQVCVKNANNSAGLGKILSNTASNNSHKTKLYPLIRALIATVRSVANAIEANGEVSGNMLALPVFMPTKDISNGREIYEGASDV